MYVKFVTIKKCSELTGYTEAAIRSKIGEGIWQERNVWVKAPDGRVLINMDGYEAWVLKGESSMLGPVGMHVKRAIQSPTLPPLTGSRRRPSPALPDIRPTINRKKSQESE